MVDESKCISCGACVGSCPVQAIEFNDKGKAEINKQKCIKCGTCQSICPVQAIEIK